MKAIFTLASKLSPAVIFIDEVCDLFIVLFFFNVSAFSVNFITFVYRLIVCLEEERVQESMKPCAK